MNKINTRDVPVEHAPPSPKGRFRSSSQNISNALGHANASDSKRASHPFDVELCSVPPGASPCPYHLHSAQSEMYIVLSGLGQIRTENGLEPIGVGDAIFVSPGEAHQIVNNSTQELVFYIIADNPIGETSYYPDSDKWGLPLNVGGPILKGGTSLDYFLDEEG